MFVKWTVIEIIIVRPFNYYQQYDIFSCGTFKHYVTTTIKIQTVKICFKILTSGGRLKLTPRNPHRPRRRVPPRRPRDRSPSSCASRPASRQWPAATGPFRRGAASFCTPSAAASPRTGSTGFPRSGDAPGS